MKKSQGSLTYRTKRSMTSLQTLRRCESFISGLLKWLITSSVALFDTLSRPDVLCNVSKLQQISLKTNHFTSKCMERVNYYMMNINRMPVILVLIKQKLFYSQWIKNLRSCFWQRKRCVRISTIHNTLISSQISVNVPRTWPLLLRHLSTRLSVRLRFVK